MALEVSQPAEPVDRPAGGQVIARVLVVVPTVGHHLPALEQLLASVTTQRDEPVDVLVVTPMGAGAVRDLARAMGARVVDDPGRGLAAAVNAGFAEAGPGHCYATWLREGVTLLPGALATAARTLDGDRGAVLAFGDCRLLGGHGQYLRTMHASPAARGMLGLGFDQPAQPATLLRLAAVTAVGGLDEGLVRAMDLDLLLRLRRQGRFAPTGHTLAVQRPLGPRVPAADCNAVVAETRQVRLRHLSDRWRPVVAAVRAPRRLLARRAWPRAERAGGWAPA